MSTHPFWISALLVAAGSLCVAQEHSPAATEGATRKIPAASIGVVDLQKALEAYPKAIKMEQELVKLKSAFREELGKIEASINETRENIRAVGENSDEGKERKFQYDNLVQLLEFRQKRMNEKLAIADMRKDLELYEDMEVAVAKVAKIRGVQLVVRTYDPGPPPTFPDKATNKELGQMQQRLQMLDRRQVWYSTDEIDLTGDLIKLLQVPLEKDAPAPVKAAEPPKPPDKPERGGK